MMRLNNGLLAIATFILTVATYVDAQCNAVGDVNFVLSASPSLGNVAFQQQKDFIAAVSLTLPVAENKFHIGAAKYSNKGVAVFYLKLYKNNAQVAQRLKIINLLPAATKVLPAEGLKIISKVSMFGTKQGGRVYAPRIAILLLDGKSENLPATISEANILKKRGIKVVVVGIGAVPLATLQKIASSNNDVFVVKSYADLVNFKAKVSQRTCKLAQEVMAQPLEKCKTLVDFVFALDTSGSITPENFLKELRFADDITKSFEIGASAARFGALLFSKSVHLLFKLNTHSTQTAITQALQAAPYLAGGTATDLALSFIRTEQLFSVAKGGRQAAKKIVVVVTDGQSNNVKNTVNMAERLKATGVTIVAIGVGQANQQELRYMASSPDLVYTTQSFDSLDEIKRGVLQGACYASQPDEPDDGESAPEPTKPSPPEVYPPFPEIEINTANPLPATTKSPSPITTPKPCPALADIVFVIDSSGSLGPDNYDKEQQFAIDISRRFPIGPSGARFGCVIFSYDARLMFDLSDEYDKTALEDALQTLPFMNSTTHTYKAFDIVYEGGMFSVDNGGRKNAAKIIIFLTDGLSSDTQKTAESAKALKDQGVSIIAVGIGQYSLAELKAVANNDRNVFTADSFEAIDKITKEVAARACEVPSEGIKYQALDDE